MQIGFPCGCDSLPIPTVLLVAKACHMHSDMTRQCVHRWRFAQTPERIYNQGSAEVLPDADVKDLGRLLSQKGYQVFRQGPSLYAFKGLAGRLGPIGVHASMLAIMAGVAIGGLGGFKGSVMVPQGGDFLVAQVTSISNINNNHNHNHSHDSTNHNNSNNLDNNNLDNNNSNNNHDGDNDNDDVNN